MAAATGWTWEYIGQRLTLPRLYALYKHWGSYPPVAVSVARYLGIAPSKPTTAANDELASFIGAMPTMKPRIAGRPQ